VYLVTHSRIATSRERLLDFFCIVDATVAMEGRDGSFGPNQTSLVIVAARRWIDAVNIHKLRGRLFSVDVVVAACSEAVSLMRIYGALSVISGAIDERRARPVSSHLQRVSIQSFQPSVLPVLTCHISILNTKLSSYCSTCRKRPMASSC